MDKAISNASFPCPMLGLGPPNLTQPMTVFSSLDNSWVDCRPGNPFAAANNHALNEIHDGHIYACGGGGGTKCDPMDT